MPPDTTEKVAVVAVEPLDGPLYAFESATGRFVTFDCRVVATAADGRRFIHSTYVNRGVAEAEAGTVPVWARDRARQLSARILAQGGIDISLWIPAPVEPTAEEVVATAYADSVEERRARTR